MSTGDRRSRCTLARSEAMEWVDFQDETDVAANRALTKILALPQIDRELLIGEITALNALAALGVVPYGDDQLLRPIRRDPEIYELKWNFKGLLFRQYHGEPRELPAHLIKLHFHEKNVSSGDGAKIAALQDKEISQALLRYRAGLTTLWNVV